MITTYIRSSSDSTLDFCEHKYYLDYVLGFHSPANKKAQKGTIVHKALEVLAQAKLCQDKGQNVFTNTELGTTFQVDVLSPDGVIEEAYQHYVKKKEYEYVDADFRDCRKWMHNVLTWRNGMFSPLKLDVISPEQYFDITINEPWAKYDFKLGKQRITGQLALKGTIDLVVRRPGNVLEIVDWKTGRRYNWNKGTVKEYEDFYKDRQLLLYHYAACQLYPQAKEVFMTIFWIQDGGPYSICFQRSDLSKTADMIKQRFEYVKSVKRPKLIYPHFKCKWCYFSKQGFGGPVENYKDSICNNVKNEIIQVGLDKVTEIRAKPEAFTSYHEGGGKTHD
jgi:ATP-dependent helicase/DNAse subunit B